MRMHYMTICFMNDTEVTHIRRNGRLEITFEQACDTGFKTLICDESGSIIRNVGFNSDEIAFFLDFLSRNIRTMQEESLGLL